MIKEQELSTCRDALTIKISTYNTIIKRLEAADLISEARGLRGLRDSVELTRWEISRMLSHTDSEKYKKWLENHKNISEWFTNISNNIEMRYNEWHVLLSRGALTICDKKI